MSQEKYLKLLKEARRNKFVDGIQVITEEVKVEEPEGTPAGAESDTKKVDDNKKLEMEKHRPDCEKKNVKECAVSIVKNHIMLLAEMTLNDKQKAIVSKYVKQMGLQQIVEFAKKHRKILEEGLRKIKKSAKK